MSAYNTLMSIAPSTIVEEQDNKSNWLVRQYTSMTTDAKALRAEMKEARDQLKRVSPVIEAIARENVREEIAALILKRLGK